MAKITFTPCRGVSNDAQWLADCIESELKKGRTVLWLLSGGSAIQLAVETRKHITFSLENLSVTLIDERFGPTGHKDSNWQQLIDAGFDMTRITAIPILQGKDFYDTLSDYGQRLTDALKAHNYILGLYGMGSDGHIAGILPGSLTYANPGPVYGYQGPDYQRLSSTFEILPLLDQGVLYACGESKREQLIKFLHQDTDPMQQPVQYLKNVKQLTVITDQEGIA